MTEAAVFYESREPGLGSEFLDDMQRTVDRLLRNPLLGQSISPVFRRTLFSRFPFSLIYVSEPDGLLIVAVAHQRRRPGYWNNRT